MSIFRIGEFVSRPESIAEMREFLMSIMGGIKSSPGCTAVQLCQSHDDPTKFTMIEAWDSIESHQASAKNISPEDLAKFRAMLASAPSGNYFELVRMI